MKNKLLLMLSISVAFMLFAMICFAENKLDKTNQKQNAATIDFFYYGPCADEDVMTAIIGKKPINGRSAILQGYILGVQNLDDIPDIKIKGLKLTAQKIMKADWQPDFQMHAAHKGKGQIKGIVWTITKEDLDAIKNWELVDYHWYSIVEGTVVFVDDSTKKVLTIAVKKQHTQKDINGLNYDLFLDKGPKFKELLLLKITENRKQYLKSISNGQEYEYMIPIR